MGPESARHWVERDARYVLAKGMLKRDSSVDLAHVDVQPRGEMKKHMFILFVLFVAVRVVGAAEKEFPDLVV